MGVTLRGDFLKSKIREEFGRGRQSGVTPFARTIGVSTSYVYALINGEDSPSLDRAVQIAQVLGVSVDDLLSIGPKEGALAMI